MLAGQATLHLTFPKNTISLSFFVSLGVHDITALLGNIISLSVLFMLVDSMCFLRYCVVFYFFQVKTICSSSYTHVWLSVTLFSNFLYREYEVSITLFAYIRCPHHAYSTPLMSLVV